MITFVDTQTRCSRFYAAKRSVSRIEAFGKTKVFHAVAFGNRACPANTFCIAFVRFASLAHKKLEVPLLHITGMDKAWIEYEGCQKSMYLPKRYNAHHR